MRSTTFIVPQKELKRLQAKYPFHLRDNTEKGLFGVEVAKLYLESLGSTDIVIESEGIDIQVNFNGKHVNYEVKSTVDDKVAYSKLKVSSTRNHDLLVGGMEIMRISKLGKEEVDIHFLIHGEDFTLVHEPRWRLKKL